MLPTEVLTAEHRTIERVLECLERLVAESGVRGRLDGRSARQILEFLALFADRCHHGKEEELLFPALIARGFSADAGPVAVMTDEHRAGRDHIRQMREATNAAGAGDRAALGRFRLHARAYIDLLREHIRKEDGCLFPMADEALTAEDKALLLERFEHLEHEEVGAGTHEAMLEVACELAHRFGVPDAEGMSLPGARCSRPAARS